MYNAFIEMVKNIFLKAGIIALGIVIVCVTTWIPFLRQIGLQPLGAVVGIIFVVFSLFGELPRWISWTQKFGTWLFPGIAIGTILLLLPLLIPTSNRESSFFAFSPSVWAAYISIVLVGISFESSSLPDIIYRLCQRLRMKPFLLVPLYVAIAGLLGNILDGVSIVTISVVILTNLLSAKWSLKALFALLFGGLISNLITVAAEPTNIKFQDALSLLFDKMHPSFWITNWPICILGIVFPTIWLGIDMYKNKVMWKKDEAKNITVMNVHPLSYGLDVILSVIALLFLAEGVILHAISENVFAIPILPLWIVLLPAGVVAFLHLIVTKTLKAAEEHMKTQWPVWNHLLVIFSLLWFLTHALSNGKTVLSVFYLLPGAVQYALLTILSLFSSVTDNVALAAMQGSIIASHPIAVWQIRLLLVLLTWSGGFTPFGCLQSLSINARIRLSTSAWLRLTPVWSGLALAGGIIGLAVIQIFYK